MPVPLSADGARIGSYQAPHNYLRCPERRLVHLPPAGREIGSSLSSRKRDHNSPTDASTRTCGPPIVTVRSAPREPSHPRTDSPLADHSLIQAPYPPHSSRPPSLDDIAHGPPHSRCPAQRPAQGQNYVAFILLGDRRVLLFVGCRGAGRRKGGAQSQSDQRSPPYARSSRRIGLPGACWAPALSSCCTRFRSPSASSAAAGDIIRPAILPLFPSMAACHTG